MGWMNGIFKEAVVKIFVFSKKLISCICVVFDGLKIALYM